MTADPYTWPDELADLRAENTHLHTIVDGVAALAAESLAVRRMGCDTYGLVAASRINALIKEARG